MASLNSARAAKYNNRRTLIQGRLCATCGYTQIVMRNLIMTIFILLSYQVSLSYLHAQTRFLEPGRQTGFVVGATIVNGPHQTGETSGSLALSKNATFELGMAIGRDKVRFLDEAYDYTKYTTVTPYLEVTGRDPKFPAQLSVALFYSRITRKIYGFPRNSIGTTLTAGRRIWITNDFLFGISLVPEVAISKTVVIKGQDVPFTYHFSGSILFGSRHGSFLYISPMYSRNKSANYKSITAGFLYSSKS